MLNILNNFLKRRNEHINLPLLIIFSLIISLVAGLLFYQTKIIWASAVLLIQTILGKEKEMEANLTDNKKFKVYQLNQKVQFKFSFFQYIKINPYFYIGLFYSFFSFVVVEVLSFTIPLILLIWASFYFMLLNKIKSKNLVLTTLIVLIIDVFIFKKGYLIISIIGIFIACLFCKIENKKIIRLDIQVFPKSIRLTVFENYKIKFYLLLSFVLSKMLFLLKNDVLSSYAPSFSFLSLIVLIVIYEIICDKNLEIQTRNLGKMRVQILGGANFVKRLYTSEYFTFLFLTVIFILVFNFSSLALLQILEIIAITCWYKFIEERALYAKVVPTTKFSYIKSFLPSTLISVHALLPIIENLLDKVE